MSTITTVPLSAITLSFAAESGDLSRDVGLLPRRHLQRPQEAIPPWSVRYAHPSLPSAGRAGPGR